MTKQKLYSYVRKALDDYQMISDGDYVAIGLSGGKDSLTLLYALHGLQQFYPTQFKICAILVDLGFENFDSSSLISLLDSLNIPFYIIKTEISNIVFKEHADEHPCSLCAKLRKGALNQKALELGCNKIAYAHHMDDFIETMFLSLLFEGRFYSFPPVTHLSRTNLTVIRPLMYAPEADIIGFKNKYSLNAIKNPCPADGSTKREYVKNLTRQLNLEYPGIKKRLFHSIINGHIEDWPKLL